MYRFVGGTSLSGRSYLSHGDILIIACTAIGSTLLIFEGVTFEDSICLIFLELTQSAQLMSNRRVTVGESEKCRVNFSVLYVGHNSSKLLLCYVLNVLSLSLIHI